jgi:hypothetical protein
MLEEMMKDSESMLSNEGLKKVGALAELAAALEADIDKAESQLKQLKEQLRGIVENSLPSAMAEVGMVKFTLKDGSEINVKPFYSAKIDDANREQAFDWLLANGHESLIKQEFTVKVDKGDTETAEELRSYFAEHKVDYQGKTGVHPQTLAAFVKEQVESGTDFPLDLFNVYIGQIAKIKRSK